MILSPVLTLAATFALGCFALALVLNLIRLFTAPTLTDRILDVDTMTVNTIALVVASGLRTGSALSVEIASSSRSPASSAPSPTANTSCAGASSNDHLCRIPLSRPCWSLAAASA
jgi:multicomponent K+:H+ antiporter subunit F